MRAGVLTISEDETFKAPLSGVTYGCQYQVAGGVLQVVVLGKLLPRNLPRQGYPIRVQSQGEPKETFTTKGAIVRKQIDMVVFEGPVKE